MFVAVVALFAGILALAGYAALSPPRITEPADASAALEPSATSVGTSTPSPAATPSPSATASRPARTPRPSPTPSGSATSTPPSQVNSPAFRVEIPALDAMLPVLPVGVAKDGQMEIPKDPSIAGWYRFGPGPTSDQGASVISAHVDSRDEVGPLARLDRLDRGDRIIVTVDGERATYVVDRVDRYAKTALDLDALFSRTGLPRLHLVSCGGEWDPRTRHYEDNVVAVARRVTVT
ncbi:hypothetical protein N802_03830 [Knoellia sinensis KCTC 19936]|uniref:Peptidase C60 n=1 Tax=Knoellia sinensis KCTC 19936 TaxID=1385520 RepID=A0A0A0J650_9MICO|nr:class F sortase [Knoellia sinensis]KGN31507.1 hypothetical protein N802_03830 [Knoellia sinensis KCTC 19936]